MHKFQEFYFSGAKEFLGFSIGGLKTRTVLLLSQEVDRFANDVEGLIQNGLADFMGFDHHVVFILLIAVLLNRQIL